MAHQIVAIFSASEDAGHAIGELKNKGYTKDISVVAKKFDGFQIDERTHQIKQFVADSAAGGVVAGAAIGGLAAVLAGLTAITIPAAGIFIAGPIATALTATAAGAVTGTVVGALVDKGIPEQRAQLYADSIMAGETLISVTVDHDKEQEVIDILTAHGVSLGAIGHYDLV